MYTNYFILFFVITFIFEIVKSLEDRFFHLGGHSLLVSRAVTSLRKQCPTISARDFYQSKGVVSVLAAIVVERIASGSHIDTKRKLNEMARLHDVRRKPRTCLQVTFKY